jgi:hypothetical protein
LSISIKMKESLKDFEQHCDITLIDQHGNKYQMQSQTLKSRSQYFAKLLSNQWNQSISNHSVTTFQIQTNKAWNDIRVWILTGRLSFAHEELFDVLEFADMYAFDSLMKYSSKKLLRLGQKNSKSTLGSYISNIEFFMQPRFFDILLIYQHSILLNHFSLSPIFTLLAAVTFRISINSKFMALNTTNWWTQSSTTDLKMKTEGLYFDPKISKSFNLYLIQGVSLKFNDLFLNTRDGYDKIQICADVYGVDANGKLFPQSFDNNNTEYFSHFLIEPSSLPENNSYYIDCLAIEGNVHINF